MQHEPSPVDTVHIVCVGEQEDEVSLYRIPSLAHDPEVYRLQRSLKKEKGVAVYLIGPDNIEKTRPLFPMPTGDQCLPTSIGTELPTIVHQAVALAASSGFTVAVYQLLKTWVDARNGRKLKIKVGDIEVEATQMAEKDVLRIFELLEEKADRAKLREILLEAANKGTPPKSIRQNCRGSIPKKPLWRWSGIPGLLSCSARQGVLAL